MRKISLVASLALIFQMLPVTSKANDDTIGITDPKVLVLTVPALLFFVGILSTSLFNKDDRKSKDKASGYGKEPFEPNAEVFRIYEQGSSLNTPPK